MTIEIAKTTQRRKRQIEKTCIKIIETENENNCNDKHIIDAHETLKQIKQNQNNGNQIRCTHTLRTNALGTPPEIIKNIESQVQERKHIKKIKDMTGKITTDDNEIRQAFEQYYTDLYKHEQTNTEIENKYTKHAKQISDTQKSKLDTTINITDIQHTIDKMNLGKSPGPDGLTVEFFQFFSPQLSKLLKILFDTIYKKGQLTETQQLSYITIIPKTKTNSTNMKDYRPISLLNTDYKILTKSLANKIKPLLTTLIHPDQTCSIPGRNIEQNTHFIRDLIDYTEQTNTKTYILSIDQEKAFDRLAHTYIHNTLQQNNIGEYFRKWIKIIYNNPKSCVIINQKISNSFPIQRSVRQGCPLSAILYTLCLENFLESVRKDPTITGTNIPGNLNKKLKAYADDTTFFPKNPTSIRNIIDKFKEYGLGSGAKINIEKSKCMEIGSTTQNKTHNLDIEWVRELKILGITYRQTNRRINKDWAGIIHSILQKIHKYQYLQTTIFERAQIANTYLIPKIIYRLKIFTPPPRTVKRFKNLIKRYILQNAKNTISYKTLTLPPTSGGIGLHDITAKLQTTRIRYIQTLIKQPTLYPIGIYYLGIRLSKFMKLNHTVPHFGRPRPPEFYRLCSNLIVEHNSLIGMHLDNKKTYNELIKNNNRHIEYESGIPVEAIKIAAQNIHKHNINKTAKDITYKFIYSIVPTRSKSTCTLCHRPFTQELTHLLLKCRITTPTIQQVINSIRETTDQPVHTQFALQHNIIPFTKKQTHTHNLQKLATLRQTIWICRNKSLHDETQITSSLVKTIYTRISSQHHKSHKK